MDFAGWRSVGGAVGGLADRDAGDAEAEAVEAGAGGYVEGAPVGVAPGQVGRDLGRDDAAEEAAALVVGPDAVRAGAVDVALLIDLHAVRDALLAGPGLQLGEESSVRDRAVAGDGEGADVAAGRVVDVEDLLVWRESQAVRALEVVDQEVQAVPWVDPEDAVERELLPLDAAAQAVRRVGEVDRAVRANDHVVGRVEPLALVRLGDRLGVARAVD